MKRAQTGDTVRVHYVGTLSDGQEFDSSVQREPLELTIGAGEVIPGFEEALVGMTVGEEKSVTLEPDDAYGESDAELIHVVDRSQIPSDLDVQVGLQLEAQDDNDNTVLFTVTDHTDTEVTVDANHPLAGKTLTFALTLVEFVSEE